MTVIEHARVWVGDRSMDMDAETLYTDSEVREFISRNYPGGWTSFAEDYSE